MRSLVHDRLLIGTLACRVKDWLHGVRPAAPDRETQRSLDKEPLTEAERLRIVHSLLTLPPSESGAGITPGKGEWSLVEGIFALHDREFNKEWMKRWSTTWTVGPEELGSIRDMFGEKATRQKSQIDDVSLTTGYRWHSILPSCSLTSRSS